MIRISTFLLSIFCMLAVFAQVPDNDSCQDARVLTPNTTPQYDTFRISGATSDVTGCRENADVWFKFEMPTSGGIRILGQKVELNHDLSFRLYEGTCGALTTYVCAGTCNYYSTGNCGTYLYLKDTSLYGDTLYIRASKYYSFTSGDTAAIAIEHILDSEIPSNDSCGAAAVLQANTTLDLDTFSLKNSLVELSSGYCRDDEDVWFKFEVPSSGSFKIRQNQYNQSTELGLRMYTGGCASLQAYACTGTCNYYNAANCGTYLYVSDPSLAGDTVWVRGAPYYDFDNRDTFAIGIEEIPTSDLVPNDSCGAAADITYTISSGMDTFSNKHSIAELSGSYCRDDEDVWFKFEVPANGAFEIVQDKYNLSTDLGLRMYTDGCASLTAYSCANGNCDYINSSNCGTYLRVIDTSLAGDTMLIRAASYYDFDNRDSFRIGINALPDSVLPSNDKCADAIMLNVNATLQLDTFDISNALAESDGSCRDDEDIWFKFVAPSNGAFLVESDAITIGDDPSLQLLMGSCGSFTTYECDSNCNVYVSNNTCRSRFLIRDSSLANDTLYIRASRYYSFTSYGTFTLGIQSFDDADLPANDDCSHASVLDVSQGNCFVDTFNNMNTTYSSVPTSTCGAYEGADVWFKFEMPSSDDVFIDLSQVGATSSDFRITAFSGGCYSLVEEDCNSSGNYPDLSLRNLGLAGDTVWVHVYRSYASLDGDTFGLCVKDTVLPPLRSEVGHFEKNTNCDILSGSGWFDLVDSTGNLVMSVDPTGSYLGRTCFGVNIQDSAANLRTALDTFSNTAYLSPRNFYIDPQIGSSATVRLYFKERELKIWRDSLSARGIGVGSSLQEFYEDSLRISKMDGSSLTNFLGGNPVQINPTVMKVRDSIIMAEFTVTSFSNFAPLFNPGNAPTPVPVDWLEFKGRKMVDQVVLNWSTASELNCSHFEIERSTDGHHFRVIGIQEGNGTVNAISSYRFVDENVSNLKLYYRLRQIDYNGESSYSNVITIQPEAEFVISPNPFKDRIDVSVEKQDILRVELIDLFGRMVFNKEVNNSKITIHTNSELDHGVYTLRIVLENDVIEKRIIKE